MAIASNGSVSLLFNRAHDLTSTVLVDDSCLDPIIVPVYMNAKLHFVGLGYYLKNNHMDLKKPEMII